MQEKGGPRVKVLFCLHQQKVNEKIPCWPTFHPILSIPWIIELKHWGRHLVSSLLGRCPSNREKKKRSKGRAKLYVSVTDWFSLKTYLEDGAVIRSENVTIQWKQNSYSVAYDHMKNRWLSSGLTAGWQKGFRDARCVISPKLPAWSVIGHRKVVRDLLFSLVTRDFPFRCPWLVNIIKTSSKIRSQDSQAVLAESQPGELLKPNFAFVCDESFFPLGSCSKLVRKTGYFGWDLTQNDYACSENNARHIL